MKNVALALVKALEADCMADARAARNNYPQQYKEMQLAAMDDGDRKLPTLKQVAAAELELVVTSGDALRQWMDGLDIEMEAAYQEHYCS